MIKSSPGFSSEPGELHRNALCHRNDHGYGDADHEFRKKGGVHLLTNIG